MKQEGLLRHPDHPAAGLLYFCLTFPRELFRGFTARDTYFFGHMYPELLTKQKLFAMVIIYISYIAGILSCLLLWGYLVYCWKFRYFAPLYFLTIPWLYFGGTRASILTVVLDPTLLLSGDDWSEIAADRLVDEPYIVCHVFGFPNILSLAMELQRKTGFRVVILDMSGRFRFHWARGRFGKATIVDNTVGPREFVSYIKHASLILTSSFHGTVFSINLRRPFLTQYEGTSGSKLSSRLTDILEKTRLSDRIYDGARYRVDDPFEIDHSESAERLAALKGHSLAFLKNALNHVGD